MRFLADVLRSRVLPAIVAAIGVSVIAAGLLTYTTGTEADLFPFPGDQIALESPTIETADPGPSGVVDPSGDPDPSNSAEPDPSGVVDPTDVPAPTADPTPIPSASATIDVLPSPLTTDPPSAAPTAGGSAKPSTGKPTPSPTAKPTATPTPRPRPVANRLATRVVIPALDIDLPVVKPPAGSTTYPLCNVAMYVQNLSQPGYDGATYLYAHARTGMFLPLLDQSKINNGRGMLGMLVQVYTNDNRYFVYQISEVRRHQLTFADAVSAKDQELWLQTSEGPRGTPGKLQVIATPISSGPSNQADAQPTPHPVVCG